MAYLALTGANLSGSTGATGRTYTLTGSIETGTVDCRIDNQSLIPDTDFTYGSNIVTFNSSILNEQYVTIFYNTTDSISISGTLYTTPALVEYEVRATSAFSSSTIPTLATVNIWIEEESRYIDYLSNNIYSATAVSSTYIDYDGTGILRFPHAPLISISGVRYNNSVDTSGASWIDLEEGWDKDYLSYLNEGEIEFLSGVNSSNDITPQEGKKKFCLSYYYGTSTVPLNVRKLATLLVTKRVINSLITSQANTEGGSVTVGTISVTDPTNFGTNQIKTINNEINDLLKSLGNDNITYRITRSY